MKDSNPLLKFLVIGLLILVGFLIFQNIRSSSDNNSDNDQSRSEKRDERKQEKATVSGNVIFTGLKPQGGDKGTLKIEYRVKGETTFQDANVTIPLVNNAPFQSSNAIAGDTYDLRAYLLINNQRVTQSELVTVTAPATNVKVPLNVTWEDLPDEVVDEYPTTIDGNVKTNGYVPSGSNIVVKFKRADEPSATYTIGDATVSTETGEYEITGALNGRDYMIYSELLSGTSVVGTSKVVTAAAPATDVILLINSKAEAPVEKTTISGSVTINGLVDSNSPLEVYLRDLTTDEVTTIASVDPVSGTMWSYDTAVLGRSYRVNAQASSTEGSPVYSKAVDFTAPATGIELVIDTGAYLEAPDEMPELISCTEVKDGTYKAKVKYENVSKAARYWLQIGTEEGLNNVYDAVTTAPKKDEDLYVEVDIPEGKDHYTNYAYSNCTDCSRTESFSEFSETMKFECPND